MIEVLKVILPVVVMIVLGVFCRKTNFLSLEGVENIKKLVTKIILPVAIFHALSTANYSIKAVSVIGMMLAMILITYGLGYLLKPLMPEPEKKYLPFMVSVYEGGMMGYPLFANLCGTGELAKIAMLDIAGLLFGFSIYMGMLQQAESGQKPNAKLLLFDAFKNPAFIATLLGIIFGITGITKGILNSPFSETYSAVESLITASLTAMILIVVGYSLSFNIKLLKPCLRTIILRILVQTPVIILMVIFVRKLFPGDAAVWVAVICYMSSPATFSMQSFLKTEEGSKYAATTNSLYSLVSIAVYVVLAIVLK